MTAAAVLLVGWCHFVDHGVVQMSPYCPDAPPTRREQCYVHVEQWWPARPCPPGDYACQELDRHMYDVCSRMED